MEWLSIALWLVRISGLAGYSTVTPRLHELTFPARATASSSEPAAPPSPRPTPSLPKESASYRVSLGIFGAVAKATLTFTPEAPSSPGGNPSRIIRAVGTGEGAVLGFARTEKHIESEFDPGTLAGRRWTSTRSSAGQVTVDGAVEASPGAMVLLRKRAGEADLAESFKRDVAVLDPLSFLLRLRLALPQAAARYEILDGRALWIAEVSAARPDADDSTLLRIDGHVDPVYWNGTPDPERTSHTFTLFLTSDRYHTPVRMVVPFGPSEVRAELVRLERPGRGPRRFMPVLSPFCRGGPGGIVCRGLAPLWSLVPTSR